MNTKACYTCHAVKTLDEFPLKRTAKDGKGPTCRECDKKRLRGRYQRDGAAMRERARAVYAENAEAIQAANREWMRKNPEAVKKHRATAEAKRGSRPEYHRDWRYRKLALEAGRSDPSSRALQPGQTEAGFSLARMRSGRYIALPFGRPLPPGAVLVSRYTWMLGQWIERRVAK